MSQHVETPVDNPMPGTETMPEREKPSKNA